VIPEDVDRVVGELAAQGLAASTRRLYVQVFKNFHAFLVARKAAAFGVRLADPVDEFNAARHVGADSPSAGPPPAPERLEEFFGFLRERIAGARKYAAARRDYALFRTIPGLTRDEVGVEIGQQADSAVRAQAALRCRRPGSIQAGRPVRRAAARRPACRTPGPRTAAGWRAGGAARRPHRA
jgi:hypothetical protein